MSGEFHEVGHGEAATRGDEQAEQVLLVGWPAQQARELAFHVRPRHPGGRRRGERADDGRRPQRVVAGDVTGDGRVRPTSHDHPHARWGIHGQQRGDAAVLAHVGVGSLVLVEPVD
ncbi:hypothetical protein Q5530_31700 [Saccharothrix sp. BKS2]|uniref:hypothetical protein n=1 Tax=Saccharothrix sp. BKS2 TaxID=3064400 RepID=UPI0039EBD09D